MRRVAAAVAPIAFGCAMLALAAFVLMAYGCSVSEESGPAPLSNEEEFEAPTETSPVRRRPVDEAPTPPAPVEEIREEEE